MKVRNGFVSNSSSSSFILTKPDEELHIKDIIDYYGITDKYGKNVQDAVAILIWNRLQDIEEEDEESIRETLEYETCDSQKEWSRKNHYNEHSDEWYEKAKKNMNNKSHIKIEVGSEAYYDSEYDYNSYFKPNIHIMEELRFDCNGLFSNPERAIALEG